MNTRTGGTRLVELLVVLLIIAALYELGMPDYMKFTNL